ncbi:MAG: hypothetical protein SF052_19405 [Bacteroidia bacterium]|nr:hypothetical protein [Bacteroidia bacterium]
MKFLLSILILTLIISCSNSTDQNDEIETEVEETTRTQTASQNRLRPSTDSSEIPPDGKYRYDIAFAEWNGKSMGEKVTVMIKGDSIKVIYEGDGQLTLAEPREILDEGILRKHKSGQWIITKSKNDTEIDEIGGCTSGPSIIDFENKKFWIC